MEELVRAASRALAAQDAPELERLLAETQWCVANPADIDPGALASAAEVLLKQVRAAEMHLRMNYRLGAPPGSGSGHGAIAGRGNPWAL